MATIYTKKLVLCVTIVCQMIRFLEQAFSRAEAVAKFVYIKTFECPLVMNDILILFYVVSSVSSIPSKRQPDYKWEFLKKCDILRFLQSQDITVFCLDDYIRDLNNGNLTRHELMRHEWARLISFETFPQAIPHAPSAIRLASNGFYYTDIGTIVECFSCRERFDTTSGECTADSHRHHSETCAFVAGNDNRNDPINRQSARNSSTSNVNDDSSNGTSHQRYVAQQSQPTSNQNSQRTSSFTSNQANIQAIVQANRLMSDMQSPMVKRILQMGYNIDMVRNAVIQLRRRQGQREPSANDLLEYIQHTEPNLVVSSTENILSAALRNFMKKKNEKSQAEKQNVVIRQLEEKVIRLEHEKLCKVCLDKDKCIVFLPCGHLVACDDCARAMRKCPVCRADIKGTVRTYMA